MNNGYIIAWLDDLQMSAHLAKISTTYSYELQFCDTISQISHISNPAAIIIDLNTLNFEKRACRETKMLFDLLELCLKHPQNLYFSESLWGKSTEKNTRAYPARK